MTADPCIGVWHNRILFFAIEIIGLVALHYYLLNSVCCDRPFAAVGVIAGITGCTAASRIISDNVVNKVLVTGIQSWCASPG